jgi:hypothetical protein
MSEIIPLPESDCGLALGMLALERDSELPPEQSQWFRGHLASCGECRAAMVEFAAMDRELAAWGETAGVESPEPAGGREQLAARMKPAAREWPLWAAPAALAAVAAAVALFVVAPHGSPGPPVDRDDAAFVEIPYLPPLDPHENTTVVRMDIQVETLIAAGYRVALDPNAVVAADVLVGEDGRAHAVRIPSEVNRN